MTSNSGVRVGAAVRGMPPGYFALVMATGIISVGMHLIGVQTLSFILMVVCAAAYLILVALTGWRLIAYPAAFLADMHDPHRGFQFFTFVAGTNVLAARLAIEGWFGLATVLLGVSGITWLLLGYALPWFAVLGRSVRPVLNAANGTWFIWVVASQSVAVVAASLEPVSGDARALLAVLAILSWSVGIFLYGAAGVFVSLRLVLYDIRPEQLDPPYWVSMGACAITVLAGARIVEMADAPMVTATRGLVAGVSVMFWAFATWLIPVLIAVGFWRHVTHRVPLRYEATLWSIAFPVGMYAVAGIYLGQADDLPLVGQIGTVSLWVALVVWLVMFTAMVRQPLRAGGLFRGSPDPRHLTVEPAVTDQPRK
ncbi:tellurite resistance protein permease [Cryobacterium sp. Hz7]|uniref:tellurite resistance/C4-dicarboxylate transporter family protein n=1 Tax=Cryobacterium sp. Hz7 TaxID=1259166 RepID=UPI00106A2462|nr:tellurite resistance/C4-dicarboxylate transporter family protein [Cryobacterium sp. Hz7]TFB67134.1 tellurite resistance protein permease [Cryobacterium sp. Hz7]